MQSEQDLTELRNLETGILLEGQVKRQGDCSGQWKATDLHYYGNTDWGLIIILVVPRLWRIGELAGGEEVTEKLRFQ